MTVQSLKTAPVVILLVDDEVDVMSVNRATIKLKIHNPIVHARDCFINIMKMLDYYWRNVELPVNESGQ